MLFHYKSVSAQGRMVSGRIDAANISDLEMRLKRLELDLVRAKPVRQSKFLPRRRISRRELINFCFYLEQMTRAGVPILEGLADLRDSLTNPRLREAVAGLIEGIEGGQSLSQAMAAHPNAFSRIFVNLVRAGEESGRLPEVLDKLAETLRWEDELASHTKKLLLYPTFIGITVVAATVFLMLFMVPQLKQFVRSMGQTLPPQASALFWVSEQLSAHWHWLLLAPILIFFALQWLMRSDPLARLRMDGLKLQAPVLGAILKKIILARFAGTFALLYAAGIPVLEAIRSTQDIVGNRAMRAALQRVEKAIGEGLNISAAFHEAGLFPPLVLRMLRVGENTGGLDEALRNVGYFYNRDVKEAVAKAQAMIEPALTLIMGALLGWIMLSVIGPIYDVISGLRP